MHSLCCFSLVLLLVPFAFIACESVTLFAFQGSWRLWALVPLGVAVLVAVIYETNVSGGPPFSSAALASAGGLAALACVWAAYSRSRGKTDETAE